MGNDQSQMCRPYSSDVYLPVDGGRQEDDRDIPMPITNKFKQTRAQTLLKSAFTGIWSVIVPNCIGPCPRTGHFYCYDENTSTTYIGYGLNKDNVPLFDLWALDNINEKWREIKLTGATLCARANASAAIVGTHLVVFGGYHDPTYFSELHTIDVVTGEVQIVQTHGQEPTPRTAAIVTIYNNKFFVWGGFDGGFPSELNVLDFSNMTWAQYPQNIAGRAAVPHAVIGDTLYVFGGSKAGGMVLLNLSTNEMIVKQTTGADPPDGVTHSGMVAVDHYLFFFGGKAKSTCTLLYACDITKLWWFVFHVRPDGDTVSLLDGSISESGLFMVPRIHSFAVSYVKQKKQIVACLGYPLEDPTRLFIVSIGEAMAFIHLREDMMSLYQYCYMVSNGQITT